MQALDFALYYVDDQGRPRDVFTNPEPGGWQEDAHTDVIHNYRGCDRGVSAVGGVRVKLAARARGGK